jgi:hypothetical protein
MEMMTFREKVAELVNLPADVVCAEAEGFLTQAGDWPVLTEVPLARVAFIVAALLQEPDPHVRRVVVSDGLSLADSAGG